MKLDALLSVADFQRAAKRRLPNVVYSYVIGGTEDEIALNASRDGIHRIRFTPRGLAGIANRSQKTTLWGRDYSSVIGVAPMGLTAICRRQCDMALAQAARSRGLPFVLSGASTVPLEDIQKQVGGIWYQGYFPGDTERLGRIIDRLKRAEIEVLVITSDTPVAANRENNERNGFMVPFRLRPKLMLDGVLHPRWSYEVFYKTLRHDGIPRFANLADQIGSPINQEPAHGFRGGRDKLTWDHMEWIRERWEGKMVIKGILHPEDALEAVRRGMDGIIISNHGGRQLDSAVSPIGALRRIRPLVPESFVVMIDGGFRRGGDVIKAMALGADMVFMGRPVLYGATVAGDRGAGRVLDIIQTEIDRDMALMGCANIHDIDVNYVELDPAYQ